MKWDSLWHGASIARCSLKSDGYDLINNACIAVTEQKISWVGPVSELPMPLEKYAKKVIDAHGFVITPGLIDAHTHLVFAGNRVQDFSLRMQGVSYEKIAQLGGGILSTVLATQKASFHELYEQSANRLKQALKQGTTSIEIKSGYGLILEAEIKQLEIIKQLAKDFPVTIFPTYLAAHAVPLEYKNKVDEYVDYICSQTLPLVAKKNLASAIDAFCETIAFSPAQIEKIFIEAKKCGLKLKIHAEQLSNSQGTLLAARYQALSADHLEYAKEEDIKAMAKAQMTAILLPGAYYFLNETKKPPLDLLKTYGVPVALATDCNPGTSPATSLTLIMNMAAVMWRLTPSEALRGVTINAAKALGVQDTLGSLEEKKMADFALWKISHPDELSYQLGGSIPHTVIKNGASI